MEQTETEDVGGPAHEEACVLAAPADQPALAIATHSAKLVADPRWDVEGFSRAAEACQCAWVRVGYLRELKELGKPIPYQQLVPDGAATGRSTLCA